MFKIGQKVVCINDTWVHENWNCFKQLPVKGEVYTVRGHAKARADHARIFLEELINPEELWEGIRGREEGSFPVNRFRPVVERKTDIAIFTKILDDVRHKAPAKVE